MIARVSGVSGVYRILPSSMGFRKDQIKAPAGVFTKSKKNDKQNGALKKRLGKLAHLTQMHIVLGRIFAGCWQILRESFGSLAFTY